MKKVGIQMIHQYKLNGYNIIIDSGSGAVHSVDDVAYDIIRMYKTHKKGDILRVITDKYPDISAADVDECLSDIEQLKNAEKLFAKDDFRPNSTKNPVIKALCLHMAHSCNLACEYCFAGDVCASDSKALMSFEVGKRALDFLVKNSGGRRNLDVDFFGGEPLLNFAVIKDLVEYARSIEEKHGKNFRFTLTTNGLLLNDEIIDFCNDEMTNVVLSLDGRKEVHDRFRLDRKGRGSYDAVLPKFRELVNRRNHRGYYIRGTFTRENLDFVNDILHMADLGFSELSLEPVVCANTESYSVRKEDLDEIFAGYENLAKEMLKRQKNDNPFTFYHYTLDLAGGPCIHKRVAGCGVGVEYLAVTPSGDFYPCHQFVGTPEFKVGNVFEGVLNTALSEKFGRCNIYTKPECEGCFARLYCAGGCPANAFFATGDIGGIYEIGCELFKKRLECAVMMKIAENEGVV